MLEALLQPYSENDKISLLIRHSNRYDIPRGTDGMKALLTEQGKINASLFGEKLSKYKINKIITTSVKRCIETAECIVKGYGKNIEIIPSDAFSVLHVTDRRLATDFIDTRGYDEWYRNIIAGIPTPGICDTGRYRELMETIPKFARLFLFLCKLLAWIILYNYSQGGLQCRVTS